MWLFYVETQGPSTSLAWARFARDDNQEIEVQSATTAAEGGRATRFRSKGTTHSIRRANISTAKIAA